MQLENLLKLKIVSTNSFMEKRTKLKRKQSLNALKLIETILSQSLERVKKTF